MSIVNEISGFVQQGRAKNVKELVQISLDEGTSAKEILNDGLIAGMMVIGKNLVKMMLEGVGIECVDLGVDAGGDQIVDAVKSSGAKVVCLSALLTTTMISQKDIINALKEAGIRGRVKVMVGGAPVTQEYADSIGADAYTVDAASAAEVALLFFRN